MLANNQHAWTMIKYDAHVWVCHEEPSTASSSAHLQTNTSSIGDVEGSNSYCNLVIDAIGHDSNPPTNDNETEPPDLKTPKLYDLLHKADEPLWSGCSKLSQLSTVARLLNIKSEGHITEKVFDDILKLLKDALPSDNKLVGSFYDTKTKHMRWHDEHVQTDGEMFHPSDAEAWKHFDRTEVINQIDDFSLKKVTEIRGVESNASLSKSCGWRKRSIFWDLPYWSTNLIRHNLDVMHIEKNVFENVFETVMDIEGKTIDNAKAKFIVSARIPWKLDMSSDSEIDYIPSYVDNLIAQIGDMDINDRVVNIKTIKEENENANINDTASTSTQIPIRNDKTTRGYAVVQSTIKKKEKYVPYEVMKNEPINPFGIYLYLDCISNVDEAIDIWETTFRIAVHVNKIELKDIQSFLERTLLNSGLRFWQHMNKETKKLIFDTDKIIANTITRAAEVIRIEFCGEGNIVRDPSTIKKYTTALLRALMLRDVEELADGVKVTKGEKVAVLDANNLRKQEMNPMIVEVTLGEGGGSSVYS
ncbi:hypothetical protein Tco_0863713 [Tanacetum coccineum]